MPIDHLTRLKIQHGVTEPDEVQARGILLAICAEELLAQAEKVQQPAALTETPLVKAA